VLLALLTAAGLVAGAAGAQEARKDPQKIEDVVVKEKAGPPGVVLTPSETVIEMDRYSTIGVPTDAIDVLKRHAIVDFRGQSDLYPEEDSITLRGFSSNRFVTAIDGLTVQKTGGRKANHIVDYALLPGFLIEKIEVLPGPHSALFDSKSIGGVINFVTRRPRPRETPKPDATLTTSYRSYNTQTHSLALEGAVDNVTYDVGYQRYKTDGYLRNQAVDSDTVFARVGYLTPAEGLVTLSASGTHQERQIPVDNPGTTLGGGVDYDSKFPVYDEQWLGNLQPWQRPTWNKDAAALRLNLDQSTPIGRLTLGAYMGKEDRDRAWYILSGGQVTSESSVTEWWQEGGKLQDEFRWNHAHTTTLGFDMVKMYDDGYLDKKTDRIRKYGGYLQHQWAVLPSLDLRLGLRYEDVTIRITNTPPNNIPGREPLIERRWDALVPKSYLTWKMDPLAPWLRDTSLSAGASRLWRAPDYHGDYNPQGRPAGPWIEDEEGMGYDLVLQRRLWHDLILKVNYSFYKIEDYIATNSTYANFSGAGAGKLRFSDYKINLDEMDRQGLEVELGGHLTDKLSFYLTWAWQEFDSKGGEPAGETAQHEQAENRVGAGLRYALLEKTTLMLDYYYQDDEIIEVGDETPPGSDNWVFHQLSNPGYNVFDLGMEQVLYERKGLFDAVLNVYVKNLFDEEYMESNGYPATDRTFGAALRLRF